MSARHELFTESRASSTALRYHPSDKHADIRFLRSPPVTAQLRSRKTDTHRDINI